MHMVKFFLAPALVALLALQAPPTSAQPSQEALQRSVEELRTSIGRWQVTTEFLRPDGSVARTVEGLYEFEWVVPDRVVLGRNQVPELAQASGILFYLNEAAAEIEMVSVGADGNLWVMTGALGGDTRTTQEFDTGGGQTSQLRFVRSNVAAHSFESRMERRVTAPDGTESWVPGNHQVFRRVQRRDEGTSTAFLVRHAEAQYPPPAEAPRNPPLNSMGKRRAEALARLLAESGVSKVYSTDTQRTRQTAAPLAEALQVEVVLYDATDLAAFASRLRQEEGSILVVGHSNTTPHLADLLGGDAGPPINESVEFDRLYVLTLRGEETVATSLLRYGEPTPENWRELAGQR